MEELRECPFCGGKARINRVQDICPNYVIRCWECRTSTKWFTDKKQAITAWNTRQDNWISVEDRLPKIGEIVLLYLNNEKEQKYTTGELYGGDRVIIDDERFNGEWCVGFDYNDPDFLIKEVVTHWRPLPGPPKAKGEE